MELNKPRHLDSIKVQITWPAGRVYLQDLYATPHLGVIFPDTRVELIGMACLPGAEPSTASEDGNMVEIRKTVPMERVASEAHAMLQALHQLRFVGEIP